MADFTLDHVVIAVEDLDAATADYTRILGREPSWRGEHPKYGTRNTLFRIDNTYIELLALSGGKGDKRWSGDAAEASRRARAKGSTRSRWARPTSDGTVNEMRDNGLDVPDASDGARHRRGSPASERGWRNAHGRCESERTALRVFFIEHLSPPEALPVAEPLDAPAGAHVQPDGPRRGAVAPTWKRRGVSGATSSARGWRWTARSRTATRASSSSGSPTSRSRSAAARRSRRKAMGKPDRYVGLAWGVDSIEKTCARLAAAGIETSGPRPGIKPGHDRRDA